MQIDLEKTVREGGALEASIPAGALDWDGGGTVEAGAGALTGKVSRLQGGFDFQASYAGRLTLECVRCLEPFPMDLDFDFRLLFVPEPGAAAPGSEHKVEQADCDLYPCRAGKVDLEAVAREQIYLQIPLKPVCREGCRGLCAVCGENLNGGSCRCGEAARIRVI